MTRIAEACRTIAGVTGTTNGILERTRRLAALGWEPHLYGESLEAGRIRAAGGVPHRLPRWPLGSRFKRRLFAWLFERAARGEDYDVVCGHGDTLSQDVLFLHNCVHAAHEAVHGGAPPAGSGAAALHARILGERRFGLLVANSRLMADDVVRRFGVPPDRVAVIHPGYDPARFKPEDRERLGGPARARLGAAPGDVLVGLVTSGDFRKRGVDVFLEALARLPPEAKRLARAVVLGQETRLGRYRRQAAAAGLGGRVVFLPPTPEVAAFYHALDVLAYPARFEEFGQSVQEAMACGVPVLTTARVGATELLRGGAREALLESPEAEPFARRLAAWLADAELRRRLGRAGADACRGNTWDENFRKTLALLEAVLREKRGAAVSPREDGA